ncbi:hypothetical protein INR49_031439 [Caranx melampygus]|nr:hypothetical protein INR49_031439 [Caranx melampygus]
MNFTEAKTELKQLLSRVSPSELPRVLDWIRNSDELDDLLVDNRRVMLQSIADDLRACLPLDAMLPSETSAHSKMQQRSRPTVHVDGFLYDDEHVDSLCEGGAMSRTYCLSCGSYKTAPLDFISHSFSVSELQFLFENVLPDLSGRTLVDVGSRLGAVLYGGCVYSSASRLLGLELSEEFVQLQNNILQKYRLNDRVQVLHADVCTQDVLLQNADVLVMNNVFEFFMEPSEQIRAWRFIMQNFRKTGSLLVTVPSLQESLDTLQQEALQSGWVEELPVDYDVYLGRDTDPDALRQIHLYRSELYQTAFNWSDSGLGSLKWSRPVMMPDLVWTGLVWTGLVWTGLVWPGLICYRLIHLYQWTPETWSCENLVLTHVTQKPVHTHEVTVKPTKPWFCYNKRFGSTHTTDAAAVSRATIGSERKSDGTPTNRWLGRTMKSRPGSAIVLQCGRWERSSEMPLLHRKAFIRQRPPADLRPDEEVFLCKITHEIFRTYDEFFERTILCNSLVWSCALTGRAGLTYLEAVESERRAKQSLQNFPQALVVPLLHLAALSRRCRLTELCEDVYTFVKDRFFPGETVDVTGRHGARQLCEILQVHSPHSSASGAPAANGHSRPSEGDAIVISDSDDEGGAFQSPPVQVNGRKKKKPLSPSVFKYTVKMMKDGHSEAFTVKANQISRRKTTLSRERLKLLFKQHCEPVNGTIALKPTTVVKYRLSEQNFSQFFPDEPPLFPFSPPSKGGGRGSPGQKKKYAERLKLWNKPREDMECEDLKELPSPIPVRTRLPPELFGEALMVLEFLRAFGEVFDLNDEFPDGISLGENHWFQCVLVLTECVSTEVLEEALVGSDPEGPLCELLFFFLSAIFQALDEEQEEVAKDQAEDLTEALDDDSDPTCSALSAVAALAGAWPQLHQGCSLKQLDLDSCTLSEILRLHILASGADCNHGNAKLRYQKQGGFTLMDDPCVELRLAEPALLKKLSCTSVYDLTPGEKLSILQALVGKLLTSSSSRDVIEDSVEEQRGARQELREVRAEQHRREREEAAHR